MYNEINKNLTLKHYAYPSIGQLNSVTRAVSARTYYIGKDENGEPMYDNTKIRPKILYRGTVKSHGTNASVVINKSSESVYFQSRENIITPFKDNAGFAMYMASFQEEFVHYILNNINSEGYDTVVVYSEWAGASIQKGVALNQLEKMSIIFDIRLINTTDNKSIYLPKEIIETIKFHEKRIYNVYEFPTFEIEIDFENPQLSINQIIEKTIEIENCCPVGKYFGVNQREKNTQHQK